jgi:hypothetical protein
MNTIRRIILIAITVLPLSSPAQTKLYVSTRGNDGNAGTQAMPFASLNKALSEAKRKNGSVIVYLSEGTYYLEKPVVFNGKDFAKEKNHLTISNFNNQQVNISGAVALKLKWEKYKDGIWKAVLKQDLDFDQLFVNGRLQQMARYPNLDSAERFLSGTAANAISKEKAAGWKEPGGGFVHALHRSEWGDFHYLITGKDASGQLVLVGGWQNNRRMGMHDKYRFVENVFEELDTANEWFYDKKTRTLYYYPPAGLDLANAKIATPQLKHLFEFRGTEKYPVRNITLEGINLSHTLRTFMENKEPLLRSDWTIYRGGAVLFDGAENCSLNNCTLTNLGGNAVFFNNFNRYCNVSGCMISNIGASAICFVGDPNAVRSPSFEYNQFVPLDRIDRTPGPKSKNYPANCLIVDNLIFNVGLTEKQSAGIQLSMCQSITVSHNSIFDVPRAGINVSEGTWGGHIIEFNDVFNTVKESGDHGSFNSWGRDRYWHPDRRVLDSIVQNNFKLATLDAVKPITIRNNRFRCDHGWDIDLDDGSSNYIICNNLCLNGGIKLREGVNRIVENNIMVNNTFHPHVWFSNSNDVFRHNIVSMGYLPINITVWGKETDYNIFPDSAALLAAQSRGTDTHSVCGQLDFENPQIGDYRVRSGSIAFAAGFKNFAMDSFGVVSSKLKRLSKKVALPYLITPPKGISDETFDFMGAKVKTLNTLGERSATGMDDTRGLLVLEVSPGSRAATFLQPNDVILSFNSKQINKYRDFLEARSSVVGTNTEIIILRNQNEQRISIEL